MGYSTIAAAGCSEEYGYSYGLYISPAVAAAESFGDTSGGGLNIPAVLVATCGNRGARMSGAPAGADDRRAEGIPAAVRGDAAAINRPGSAS